MSNPLRSLFSRLAPATAPETSYPHEERKAAELRRQRDVALTMRRMG